jgi:hypothetical protein
MARRTLTCILILKADPFTGEIQSAARDRACALAGLHLGLTNVQADFYHGLAAGWAEFNFPHERPTEFQFGLAATNVLLPSLVSDLAILY